MSCKVEIPNDFKIECVKYESFDYSALNKALELTNKYGVNALKICKRFQKKYSYKNNYWNSCMRFIEINLENNFKNELK